MDIHNGVPAALGDFAECATGGGYHLSLHADKLDHELPSTQAVQPPSFARIVEHPDFGAALLVSTGEGRPFYIPKSRKQLAQMIEEAARIMAKLP
jgi:hypothetical protein